MELLRECEIWLPEIQASTTTFKLIRHTFEVFAGGLSIIFLLWLKTDKLSFPQRSVASPRKQNRWKYKLKQWLPNDDCKHKYQKETFGISKPSKYGKHVKHHSCHNLKMMFEAVQDAREISWKSGHAKKLFDQKNLN